MQGSFVIILCIFGQLSQINKMRIVRLVLLFIFCSLNHLLDAQKIDIALVDNSTEINELCPLSRIRFKLDSTAKSPYSVVVKIGGNAIAGVDYTHSIPTTIIFAIGDSSKDFDLMPIFDGIEEGLETIIITALGQNQSADTLNISIKDHIIKILGVQDSFNRCSNEPFTISTTSAEKAILTWSAPDMVKPGIIPGTFIISPLRTTDLVVTGTLGACTEKDTIHIISRPIGVTLNTKDTLFLCFPATSRLIASVTPANATVVWSPLDSSSQLINATNLQIGPPKSAQYIVSVTSGTCHAADTVFVRMDSLRDTKINIFPKKDKYCQGDSIFFFSQGHPKDLFPSIKPMWSPSNGFQTPADTFNAILMADKTTTYFRTTVNNACRQTDSVYIKVVEPSIPVGPVDTVVCPGTTVQIVFNKDSSEYKDFKWTEQDGLISCEKCPDPKIKVNGMQMYKVEAKKDGCDATTEITTNVFQKPSSVRLGADVPAPFIAGSTIKVSLLGTDQMRAVKWSIDGTTVPGNSLIATLEKIKPGNHPVVVEVTDANGCMWSYNFTLVVVCPPSGLSLTRTPTGVVYEGTNVTVNAVGISSNVTDVKWSVNGNGNGEKSLTLRDKPNQAGTVVYRFDATDVNGCPIAATISIQVIPCISPAELREKIPNAFSPNGDMKNDFFFYSDGALQITKLVIYSRWGQLVYNNSDPENGWDGKVGGSDAASDVYLYRMTYICGDGSPQEVSGTVTLLR